MPIFTIPLQTCGVQPPGPAAPIRITDSAESLTGTRSTSGPHGAAWRGGSSRTRKIPAPSPGGLHAASPTPFGLGAAGSSSDCPIDDMERRGFVLHALPSSSRAPAAAPGCHGYGVRRPPGVGPKPLANNIALST